MPFGGAQVQHGQPGAVRSGDEGAVLRNLVNTQHQNVGVLSAFMTALAGQIYVSPPSTFKCLGPQVLDWQLTIQWFSMGFFFAGINASIIMASA